MAKFASETLKVKKVAILVDVRNDYSDRPPDLLPRELQAAGRHDRLRAVVQRGGLGLPRAADADQVGQPRGDLRARLLHGGRHDRPAGAGARHPLDGSPAGRRRLGLAEALGDRRRGPERLLLLQPLLDGRPLAGRPEVRHGLQGALQADARRAGRARLRRGEDPGRRDAAGRLDGRPEGARRAGGDQGLRGRDRQDHDQRGPQRRQARRRPEGREREVRLRPRRSTPKTPRCSRGRS